MASRLSEFFESDNGGLSMNRLLLMGSFFITSFIMILLSLKDKMSEGYLTIFLTAFVIGYAASKTGDVVSAIKAPPPNNPS